jgi:aminoglycoside/choline kinase family phosphotransferase
LKIGLFMSLHRRDSKCQFRKIIPRSGTLLEVNAIP